MTITNCPGIAFLITKGASTAISKEFELILLLYKILYILSPILTYSILQKMKAYYQEVL